MKLSKLILSAGIMAAFGVSVAQADVTIYITGATAYRSPAVASIKAYLTGGFTGIYGAKSGVTSELNAANCAFIGTRTANPELGNITVKCAWGGSVGGVKLIQSTTAFNINDQPGVKGWIPDTALATVTAGTIFAGTETSTQITGQDTSLYTFESGGGAAKPDAAFTDAFQSSALAGATGDAVGLGTDTATGKIAVIPFDIVVSNGVTPGTVTRYDGVTYASGTNQIAYTSKTGDLTAGNIGRVIGGTGIPLGATITADSGSTLTISANTTAVNEKSPSTTSISSADTAEAPISNINSNQFNQIMVGGGNLAMFTGNSLQSGTAVYCYGRNADSGTRVSALGESYLGITKRPSSHLQPSFTPAGTGTGAGGDPGKLVTGLIKWPLQTVLGVTYTAGQSGYTSGGDIAAALSSPGAQLITPTSFSKPGWIIGYVGRSDSNSACAKTFGQNTAKRLTFNGQQDWNGAANANLVNGSPASGYNDDAIRQGVYQAWEFEHFYKKGSITSVSDKGKVLDQIATDILGAAAPSGSIKLSTMAVTKTVEGGPISYP